MALIKKCFERLERWWVLSSVSECEGCDNEHVTSMGQRKTLKSLTRSEPITTQAPKVCSI